MRTTSQLVGAVSLALGLWYQLGCSDAAGQNDGPRNVTTSNPSSAGAGSGGAGGHVPIGGAPGAKLDEPCSFGTAAFPHFDAVVDASRGDVDVWAHFVYVDEVYALRRFTPFGYANSSGDVDFWPASTVKLYTATAALALLSQYELSLDAQATFYHWENGAWIQDVQQSMRETIRGSLHCSSNEDYTLLLRFVGIDWVNQQWLGGANGFEQTALMQGYVSARPYGYYLDEPQRVELQDGSTSIVREHSWSQTSYADQVGCTAYNASGRANCTTVRDLTEHLRRIVYDDVLPSAQRLAVRAEDLQWLREGDDEPVLNDPLYCGGPGWDGISEVLPSAQLIHKGGTVTDYRLSVDAVYDPPSHTEYVSAIAIASGEASVLTQLSEAIARMALTPHAYAKLDNLVDHVNPVRAELMVYAAQPATVELLVKPGDEDGRELAGYWPLPGSQQAISAGVHELSLVSACLDSSATYHVLARVSVPGKPAAYSDRHYVIVDSSVPCPSP